MQNDFLWLDNDPQVSQDAWKSFRKNMAMRPTKLNRVPELLQPSPITSGRNGQQPVYMAAQF